MRLNNLGNAVAKVQSILANPKFQEAVLLDAAHNRVDTIVIQRYGLKNFKALDIFLADQGHAKIYEDVLDEQTVILRRQNRPRLRHLHKWHAQPI